MRLPQFKMLCFIGLTTLLLYVQSSIFTVTLFIVTLGIIFFIKTHILKRKRLIPLCITTVVLVCFQVLFNTRLPISERLLLGILSGIRILTLSSLVLIYTSVTSGSEIIGIFSFLPRVYQLLLTVTFTTIPFLFEEATTISLVQKSRGLRTSWVNPLKGLLPIILPLLHAVFTRSEQMSMVMVSRGFSIEARRSNE